MADRTDKAALLDAVATFLTEDLRPQVEDKALAMQVLTAASLAQIAADEARHEHDYDEAQLLRLRALLPDVEVPANTNCSDTIRHLNEIVVQQIESGEITPESASGVWCHIMQTNREQLARTDPNIDAHPPIV